MRFKEYNMLKPLKKEYTIIIRKQTGMDITKTTLYKFVTPIILIGFSDFFIVSDHLHFLSSCNGANTVHEMTSFHFRLW